MPDSRVVEELLCLVEKYPGKRPLELHIKSKLADVVIESNLKVSDLLLQDKEIENLGLFIEESLAVE